MNRRPIVTSVYEIFKTDIQPKNFEVIGFSDFIDDETVDHAREILLNPAAAADVVNPNYDLGRRYYAYATLEKRLAALVSDCLGDY